MSTPSLAITEFGGAADAPLLLLGPSLGTSVEAVWGACATRLTSRFRVVGWDLPGHGRSAPASGFDVAALASAVAGVADAEGARTFHYAGVSLGGIVGLQLLLDAPARVTAATLVCTAARIGEPAAWHERAAVVRASGTEALLAGTPARWFAPAFTERDFSTAQALLDALVAADDESYAAACDALAAFDVRDRLGAISAPVTAVAGRYDQVAPVAEVQRIADGVVRGRFVELPDVGHMAPAEAPDVVAALVSPALDTVLGAADVRAAGLQVRREVLGDAYVDGAMTDANEVTREFQEFITQYAWGTVWTRPGLDRRSRSMITLTALVALGHHDEFELHLRAARRNGLTVDEIKEVLLHTAIYCGVPAANTAFRIARRVLDEDAG
jgi:3-oxoadipate enol-lactonase/4-carboxymuconolactone decarboxylase